jgi:ferredoxin-type protein NapH
MGQHKKLYKLRKLIMYLWVIMLPITFNWMSPVLIIMGGFEGYITLSFVVFSVWFLSSLFVGRAYCAYGCQWGASQEILGDAIPKVLDPLKKDKRRKIKYVVFVTWIIFVILGPILNMGYVFGFSPFYPNPTTQLEGLISFAEVQIGQYVFYFGIIGSVAILFTLMGGKRAFCAFACPMGVLGIIGTKIKNLIRYPSLHLDADVEKCTNCKKCTRNCVMSLEVNELVQKGDMYHSDCILCGNCVNVCPTDTIHYAWKWKHKIKTQ